MGSDQLRLEDCLEDSPQVMGNAIVWYWN